MPRKPHKYHFIYKTVCNVNNKFYIGMHSTSNLEDGYMGSGKVIRYSLIKYGKQAHTFEILEIKEDRESVRLREKEIVNSELLKDPLCMNIHLGGVGFEEHSQKSKDQISKGLKKSYSEIYGEEEAIKQKKKRSLKAKAQWENISDEQRQIISTKISEALKQHKSSSHISEELICTHCKKKGKGLVMFKHHFDNCPLFTGNPRKGHKWSEEAKAKAKLNIKHITEETRTKYRNIIPSNKGIKSERKLCPHCNKDVAVTVKNRNHFDNCKLK